MSGKITANKCIYMSIYLVGTFPRDSDTASAINDTASTTNNIASNSVFLKRTWPQFRSPDCIIIVYSLYVSQASRCARPKVAYHFNGVQIDFW